MSFAKRMVLTCFGLGCLPVAPGSWGSLPPAIIFGLMCYFALPVLLITSAMAVLILAGTFVCVRFSGELVASLGEKDPGRIVADEFAGQALTFLILPAAATEIAVTVTVAGFLIFRIFDIIKPWPIKKIEKLPRGWGILCDDLMAGFYALIVLNVFIFLL